MILMAIYLYYQYVLSVYASHMELYSPTKETVHGKNCYIFSTMWPIDTKFTDNILRYC
jgi:hypothetical protein